MASKNKIIVHIGDDLLYETIMANVARSGKKASEFVRDILDEKLKDDIYQKKEKINNSYSHTLESNYSSVYPLNITVDAKRQNTKSGSFFFNKINEVIFYRYEYKFFGMMSSSLKKLISSTRKEVLGLIPEIIGNQWNEFELQNESADVNLVFVDSVDVFVNCIEEAFIIKIKIHFHVSRFPISAIDMNDDFLRIDFLNIHYRRFKDVAINGRLSKIYDRLLYIKPTKDILLGGFFAGLLYNPKDKKELVKEIDNLIFNQEPAKNGMSGVPGRFVKVHINTEQVKIDRRSFSKAFKLIEERNKSTQ